MKGYHVGTRRSRLDSPGLPRRIMFNCGVFTLLLSMAVMVTGCGDDDGGDIDILECEGSCECDNDTRTCSCLGGSECLVEGEEDITLVCEGNAKCDLQCESLCNVECPGTAGCTAEMGDDSTAVCNGTGDCEYLCNGDCVVDCPGSSACLVTCAPDSVCEVTNCSGGQLEDCGDGVYACRTTCPPN